MVEIPKNRMGGEKPRFDWASVNRLMLRRPGEIALRKAIEGEAPATRGLEKLIAEANRIAGRPVYTLNEVLWWNNLSPQQARLRLRGFVQNSLLGSKLRKDTPEFNTAVRVDLERRVSQYVSYLGKRGDGHSLVSYVKRTPILRNVQIRRVGKLVAAVNITVPSIYGREFANLKDFHGITASAGSVAGVGTHEVLIRPNSARNWVFAYALAKIIPKRK
ncbi:MAG: hypothetical protein ABIG96_02345 [Candidatus Micrarchaeota archaeon]